MTKTTKKVVAMVLCHNCEGMLEQAKKRIPFDYFHKVYLIENGSSDNSEKEAENLGFEIIKFNKNYGYGRAVKRGLIHGFLYENADYVVEIHGDGAEFDPHAVYPATKYIEKGYDLITGSRFIKKSKALENGMSLLRFCANIFLSFFDRKILKLNLTEFHVGFKVYSKNLFENIPWEVTSDNYLHNFEVISQCAFFNLKVAEVEVEADYKSAHQSVSLMKSANYALTHFITLIQFLFAKHLKIRNKLFTINKFRNQCIEKLYK